MIRIRKADERGRSRTGWLDSRHTFSFGDYFDPANMGFRKLRVINDDRVVAGGGFPTHGHRDMEIISYVLEGQLSHKDSIGTGSVISPGEVQRMTAGTGIRHSEQNASAEAPVHFLQIWIEPDQAGLAPGYEQKQFAVGAGAGSVAGGNDRREGGLQLVASQKGRDGSVVVHQDVDLFVGRLAKGKSALHALSNGRHAWVQVARGKVTLGSAVTQGAVLSEGDGAALSDESQVELHAGDEGAEVLVFDLG